MYANNFYVLINVLNKYSLFAFISGCLSLLNSSNHLVVVSQNQNSTVVKEKVNFRNKLDKGSITIYLLLII